MKTYGRTQNTYLRFFAILLIIFTVFVSVPPIEAYADDAYETTATAAIVVNTTRDMVLYEKDADKQVYPASTTKVLMALVVSDSIKEGKYSLEDTFAAYDDLYFDIPWDGSTEYIQPGEIMTVDDPLARFFYETECIKCCWSVKELRRQIATNLYFRAGVSKKPELLLQRTETNAAPVLTIKDPFSFEFLDLRPEAFTENDLENALITHLQEFLLEMGKGFCFEARQKRMIIDDEYYFADLVFYHRVLHCSVIIELKDDEFKHADLSQLNAYVSYYKENEMNEGDNPPIGILLCTRKGEKMVEYALAGMDNNLFVSTYMLSLPDKKTLQDFLLRETQTK